MNDFDEMQLLTRLRDEVPAPETAPDARRAFRAHLAGLAGAVGRSRRRRARILAAATAVAAGVTAGLVVLALPSGSHPSATSATAKARPAQAANPAGTPLTAQLLADVAAKAALARPAVKPGQWVYRRIELDRQPLPSFIHAKFSYRTKVVEDTWSMADGAGFYTTGTFWEGVTPEVPYSQLASLPANPEALDAYLAHLDYPSPNATTANKATAEFSDIRDLLTYYVLPPALTAELFHALADIPTVIAEPSVQDIGGQSGPAFILPQNSQSVNQEIILSPGSYQLLATADWETGGHWVQRPGGGWSGPVPFKETAVLKQAFVSRSGRLP
jgi:hypothetical protein